MKVLQDYSEECWNIVHTENVVFEVERLSEGMPAFITTYGQPMLYVKYPTFKIQIFDGCDIELLEDGKYFKVI